jgi:hypothetical protein
MSESQIRHRKWYYISTIVSFAIICILIFMWIWYDYKIAKPLRESFQIMYNINDTIKSLEYKYPPDITHDQWNVAVMWTYELSGHSLLFRSKMKDLRRFQNELDERVKGKVDMNLIFWIWDEHAMIAPLGQWYKQKYQKDMLDEMHEAAKGIPTVHRLSH